MMDDIMNRVQDHFEESLTMFDKSRIVGIFLQGSQNYGLQIPTSDVDTKLIVTPTNGLLRFDFAIFKEDKLYKLVEFDGR